MKAPPRRPDQKLFDNAVMARGLWQGVGLFVLLLCVFAGSMVWLPADARRDDTARALTFVVLVLSNLGLIHANRTWGHTAHSGRAEPDRQFAWIAGGTVVVLGTVLGVPAISRLFSFSAPPPVMLLAAVAVAGLGMVWFDVVKRIRSRPARPVG
jgi:Ca2+-transporting ATPase